jgi:hypothetical protein
MVAGEMGAIYRSTNRHSTSNMRAVENLPVRVGSAPHHRMVGQLPTSGFSSLPAVPKAIF